MDGPGVHAEGGPYSLRHRVSGSLASPAAPPNAKSAFVLGGAGLRDYCIAIGARVKPIDAAIKCQPCTTYDQTPVSQEWKKL